MLEFTDLSERTIHNQVANSLANNDILVLYKSYDVIYCKVTNDYGADMFFMLKLQSSEGCTLLHLFTLENCAQEKFIHVTDCLYLQTFVFSTNLQRLIRYINDVTTPNEGS